MDLMHDTLADGSRLRVLAVIDTYRRECLALVPQRCFGGEDLARILGALGPERGLSTRITVDNVTEFTARALDARAYWNQVELDFSRPGKPVDNTYIEAFNGSLRPECLSQHWFVSIPEAAVILADWQREYNTDRPHSSLGHHAPLTHKAGGHFIPNPDRLIRFAESRSDDAGTRSGRDPPILPRLRFGGKVIPAGASTELPIRALRQWDARSEWRAPRLRERGVPTQSYLAVHAPPSPLPAARPHLPHHARLDARQALTAGEHHVLKPVVSHDDELPREVVALLEADGDLAWDAELSPLISDLRSAPIGEGDVGRQPGSPRHANEPPPRESLAPGACD